MNIDKKVSSSIILTAALGAMLALFLFAPDTAWANPAQERLCNVGLNLGGAYGRLKFFEDPPPEQVAAIAANLTNAAGEMDAFAVEAALINPIHAESQFPDYAPALLKLAGEAASLTSADASRIRTIKGQFGQRLSYYYTSENQRGAVWGETCDSNLLDVCFHFAAAHIAAATREPQHEHVGMMQRQIREGIKLSFDNTRRRPNEPFNPANDPFDPDTTLCCNFGYREQWAPILALNANSTWEQFTALEGTLRGLVAGTPLPFCGKETWVDGRWSTYWKERLREKGWTHIGRRNRFCRSELACLNDQWPPADALPECDAESAGMVIQNRASHNGCIARGCEGGTQRIDRDSFGNPVEPYDAVFDTYECKASSAGRRPIPDPTSCDDYAESAVAQFKELQALYDKNQVNSCRPRGNRWTADRDGHYNWCTRTSPSSYLGEHRAREAALTECAKHPAGKDPGKGTGTTPGMWYFVASGPYGGGRICLTESGVARLRNDPNTRKIEPLNESCDIAKD